MTLSQLGFLRNAEAHFIVATAGENAWLTEEMMDAQLRQLRTRLQASIGAMNGADQIVEATATLRQMRDSASFGTLEGLLRAHPTLQQTDPVVVADAWAALGALLDAEEDEEVKDSRAVLECYRRALALVQGVAGPRPDWLGAVALRVVGAGPAAVLA